MAEHRYEVSVVWTGNTGTGTSGYRAYQRTHDVSAPGRPVIAGSADPQFRGDGDRWNPEQLLVVSLSQCHLLWYLHLCADAGVVVTDYRDAPLGTMVTGPDGGGSFREVVLRPRVSVAAADMVPTAERLHARAQQLCFVANSVSFPVRHEPVVTVSP